MSELPLVKFYSDRRLITQPSHSMGLESGGRSGLGAVGAPVGGQGRAAATFSEVQGKGRSGFCRRTADGEAPPAA